MLTWNAVTERRHKAMGDKGIKTNTTLCATKLKKNNNQKYTSHSYRQSAATALIDNGMSRENTKQAGGWKSDKAMDGYIDNSKTQKLQQMKCLVPNVEVCETEEMSTKKVSGGPVFDTNTGSATVMYNYGTVNITNYNYYNSTDLRTLPTLHGVTAEQKGTPSSDNTDLQFFSALSSDSL